MYQVPLKLTIFETDEGLTTRFIVVIGVMRTIEITLQLEYNLDNFGAMDPENFSTLKFVVLVSTESIGFGTDSVPTESFRGSTES